MWDGCRLIWSLLIGLFRSRAALKAASFSGDGHQVVTGGDDCAVRLWDVAAPSYSVSHDNKDQALIELARKAMPHSLSDAEKARNFLQGPSQLDDLNLSPSPGCS
jgi:WD40 repeat protein